MPEANESWTDEAAEMIRTFEETAREALSLVVEFIRSDDATLEALGIDDVEELGEDAYFLRARDRTVALRPGITGETHSGDRLELYRHGAAAPAIFVNTVECLVSEDREEMREAIIGEIGDQLTSHGDEHA